MNIEKLQSIIVDALEDVKGQDIVVFDTSGMTSLFDRVVIASGTSNRQTRSLANNVREKIKEAGGTVGNIEGEDTGEWVLLDCIDAVVHVMQPAIRQYYRLEEIWGGKPVDVKRASGKTKAAKPVAEGVLVKKSHIKSDSVAATKEIVEVDAIRSAPAKKVAKKVTIKAPVKAPAAKRTVSKATTAAGPAKKVAAKKAAPAKKAVAAKTPVKKIVVKAAVKKAAVKKAPAKKAAAKKEPAKKTVKK
jgi:ribosome-associated protein